MWVNDAVMALFFLLVGLEIKREILVGELSSLRQAALPFAAALGGVVAPAVVFLAVAPADMRAGWAIPTATDSAFALGVLALVAPQAPAGLKVFLAALAIVDDMCAVIVIALFYTAQVHVGAPHDGGGDRRRSPAQPRRRAAPGAVSRGRARALSSSSTNRASRHDRRRGARAHDPDTHADQRR
jgi:hypothetical protein